MSLRLAAWLSVLLLPLAASAGGFTRLDHGRFTGVRVFAPEAPARQVVLYLGAPAGWQPDDARNATTLQAAGALVVGIDGAQMRQAFDTDGGDCGYPAGDLENLSRFVQAYTRQQDTRLPVLVSQGDGALVYAALAQVPPGHFAGGVVQGLAPQISQWKKPLCAGAALRQSSPTPGAARWPVGQSLQPAPTLANPLVVLTDSAHGVAPFAAGIAAVRVVPLTDEPRSRLAGLQAAVASLSAQVKPLAGAAPADLGTLPVIEARAPGNEPTLAIFWSGDGGWASIDKEISDALQSRGISVVGVDSLRYFWSARTPADVARDTAAIARHYLAAWGKQRLLVIGFSQGADVLPFALTRLDAPLRARLALFAALSLSERAVFEFHLSNWVSDSNEGLPTAPEMARLSGLPTLCVYGKNDADSVCGKLPRLPGLTVVKLAGDHHFDGDYATVATLIAKALPLR